MFICCSGFGISLGGSGASNLGGFTTGTVIFLGTGEFCLARRVRHLVAAAATAATGTFLRDPHDVVRNLETLGRRRRRHGQAHDEQDNEEAREVREERNTQTAAEPATLCLTGGNIPRHEPRVRACPRKSCGHRMGVIES